MKTILLISAAISVAISSNAQTNRSAVRMDEKSLAKQGNIIKEEKKQDRHEVKKLTGKEVSYQAREHFQRDFGNVPGVSWTRDLNYDVARFIKDGMEESAFYDYDGQLVGTTVHKSFDDLPAKAREYINEKFAGYTKADVLLFDDNEFNETDMILYGQQFEDEDNYFIELVKDGKRIILKSDLKGAVSYFGQIK